jgi:lycopene elongase/hydratase (dihydrobisanhydrobacterioruberin-forming)
VTNDHHVWAVLRLTRPWFWPLGWVAAHLGTMLATGSWYPPAGSLLEWVLAMVVLGPLVWGAVLAVNDLYDLPTDRNNPRKSTAPLVTGVLTAAEVARIGRRCTVVAIGLALLIGPAFALGTGVVLLLGRLYSAPPIRLKARAGADVLVNAVAVGVLAPLAGWSLYRPLHEYPVLLMLLGTLLAAALYLPTTVTDLPADRAAGLRTAAVTWSAERCYRIGLLLWGAATALWLAVCHLELLVAGDGWWLQTLAALPTCVVYAVATRRPTIGRMAVVAAVFLIPAADFLIRYVEAGGVPG